MNNMAEPGTRIVGERSTVRHVAGIDVTETVIEWNATDRISVDYRADDVELWADPADCTSFDAPLDDEELRELLAEYALT
jgi:hypothetical protein